MRNSATESTCPQFQFKFTGKCRNNNCIFWSDSDQTACLSLDLNVQTATDLVTARNSALLTRLAGSEDPEKQLEASNSLLRLALVFGLKLQEFEVTDIELCSCGARKSACRQGKVCEQRKQWLKWLSLLFQPIVKLNDTLIEREVYHLLLKSILTHTKTHKLPALLESAVATLEISRRLVK